jgi:hypothetical protein
MEAQLGTIPMAEVIASAMTHFAMRRTTFMKLLLVRRRRRSRWGATRPTGSAEPLFLPQRASVCVDPACRPTSTFV